MCQLKGEEGGNCGSKSQVRESGATSKDKKKRSTRRNAVVVVVAFAVALLVDTSQPQPRRRWYWRLTFPAAQGCRPVSTFVSVRRDGRSMSPTDLPPIAWSHRSEHHRPRFLFDGDVDRTAPDEDQKPKSKSMSIPAGRLQMDPSVVSKSMSIPAGRLQMGQPSAVESFFASSSPQEDRDSSSAGKSGKDKKKKNDSGEGGSFRDWFRRSNKRDDRSVDDNQKSDGRKRKEKAPRDKEASRDKKRKEQSIRLVKEEEKRRQREREMKKQEKIDKRIQREREKEEKKKAKLSKKEKEDSFSLAGRVLNLFNSTKNDDEALESKRQQASNSSGASWNPMPAVQNALGTAQNALGTVQTAFGTVQNALGTILQAEDEEEWIDVLPKTRISPGEMVPVTVAGIDLLVIASKDGRRLYSLANACPHLGTPLDLGTLVRLPVEQTGGTATGAGKSTSAVVGPPPSPPRWTESDVASILQQDGCEDCIVCPTHRTAFALESGEVRGPWCPYPPVLGNVMGTVKNPTPAATFDVRTQGKFIQVRLNTPIVQQQQKKEDSKGGSGKKS